MIKFLICVTLCFLDHNLLVRLCLSFYYLFYLEDLMCFVQVFSASVSGYRYICSKFITAPMIHDRGSDMRMRERALCYINYDCFAHSS